MVATLVERVVVGTGAAAREAMAVAEMVVEVVVLER